MQHHTILHESLCLLAVSHRDPRKKSELNLDNTEGEITYFLKLANPGGYTLILV